MFLQRLKLKCKRGETCDRDSTQPDRNIKQGERKVGDEKRKLWTFTQQTDRKAPKTGKLGIPYENAQLPGDQANSRTVVRQTEAKPGSHHVTGIYINIPVNVQETKPDNVDEDEPGPDTS